MTRGGLRGHVLRWADESTVVDFVLSTIVLVAFAMTPLAVGVGLYYLVGRPIAHAMGIDGDF